MLIKKLASPLIEKRTNGITNIIAHIRLKSREKRAKIFRSLFEIDSETKILDLGGYNGAHINFVLNETDVKPQNVYVADIKMSAVKEASTRFKYNPVILRETEEIPFDDKYFDIVFCSSVLEHVTGEKSESLKIVSDLDFRNHAKINQSIFAREILRLGKSYFVQVPYFFFPIETHTWLPFFSYLSRKNQLLVIKYSNKYWIKKTQPDYYLPSISEMESYFPGSTILKERVIGLTKSIISYKADK